MQKVQFLFMGMVSCLLFLLSDMTTGEVIPSKDDIIIGMRYNESLIQDIEVVYNLQIKQIMPVSEVIARLGESAGRTGPMPISGQYVWAKKGIMEYYEEKEEHILPNVFVLPKEPIITTKLAYDGEKTMTWSSVNEIGGIYAGKRKTIESDTRPSQFAGLEYQHNGVAFSQLFTGSNTTLIGRETLNSRTCYVLESKPENDRAFGIKAWIDIERGYRPLKIQHYIGPRLFRRYEIIQLQEVNPGIWFPTQSKLSTYWRNEDATQGEQLAEYDMKVNSIKINTGLPNEMFRLTYDPGTLIYDDIIKTSYRIEPVP